MNFITGHGFKNFAHYIFDEHGFRKNKTDDDKITTIFVKTDYIDVFFNNNHLLPNNKFQLITHNSDYTIDQRHIDYINRHNLYRWFAQNVNYQHKKLIPIPIGIANAEWPHGDISVLQNIINQNYSKQQLLYANFNIKTNYSHRKYCLEHIPSEFVENNVSFETYLTNTAKAYFSVCPLGNGIDSHRIWESLYLKTLPIVEKTYNIEYLIKKYNLPIITINNWSELVNLQLDDRLYKKHMQQFDPSILNSKNIIYGT